VARDGFCHSACLEVRAASQDGLFVDPYSTSALPDGHASVLARAAGLETGNVSAMDDGISARQFRESDGVEDWPVLGDGACCFFPTASFEASIRFVSAIGRLDGIEHHRPDVDIRFDGVTIRLITITGDYYGMSARDVVLARQISAVAREQDLPADSATVQNLLVIPGAPVTAEVTPFWRAVLGYEPRGDSPADDLVDPHQRGAAFWFEGMREPRPGEGGGAIHVAVWVPYEQAEARLAAALAAGGRLVFNKYAPAWWTLADAAGNEVDIATTMSRD
jgi:4a-hydroxytetrahydrobiopterin dehydratase